VESENLLTQAANVQASGTRPAEIQSLALSCHARMLEMAESDKPAAVRYALAGAGLLSSLGALGGVLPDWLVIHEEQCCRYGCIWIHELLLAGDGEAEIWVSDALRWISHRRWRPVYDIEQRTRQLRIESLESEKRSKQLESEFEQRELERDKRLKLLKSEIELLRKENERLAALESRMDALLLNDDSSSQTPPATGSN
jgi:hypothetical protein